MEKARTPDPVAWPVRKDQQRLHGYVREHAAQFERALSAGVPWDELVKKVRVAGFPEANLNTVQIALYRARRKPLFAPEPAPQVVSAAVGSPPKQEPVAQVTSESHRHPAQQVQSEEAETGSTVGKRFYELARGPLPGSNEPDPLF